MELDRRRRPYCCSALVVHTGEPCKNSVRHDGGRCSTHLGKPHHRAATFETFECIVCYEMCDTEERALVTTCGHRFHRSCIDAYRKCVAQTRSPEWWACPKCRATQRASGPGAVRTPEQRARRDRLRHAVAALVDPDIVEHVMRIFEDAAATLVDPDFAEHAMRILDDASSH